MPTDAVKSRHLRFERKHRDELVRLICKRLGEIDSESLPRRAIVECTGLDLTIYDVWCLREGDPECRFAFRRLTKIAEALGLEIEMKVKEGRIPRAFLAAESRTTHGRKPPWQKAAA